MTGALPESLGQLQSLEYLYLAGNQLTGALPESLGQLQFLRYLVLAGNQLTGSLPESLGQLQSLQVLDLSYNQLTGSLPESLGQLQSLRVLDLSANSFTGELKDVFFSLDRLVFLGLGDNQWNGPPPAWLNSLSSRGVSVEIERDGQSAFMRSPILKIVIDTSLRVDTNKDGFEVAELSFSGTSTDGTISKFYYFRNDELIWSTSKAQGMVELFLFSGLNELKFLIVDDKGNQTEIEKSIRVSAPPEISLSALSLVVPDTDGSPGELVSLVAEVEDIDNDPYSIDWYIDGVKHSSGNTLTSASLRDGINHIEAKVIENLTGLADLSSLNLEVLPPEDSLSMERLEKAEEEANDLHLFERGTSIDLDNGQMFACVTTVKDGSELASLYVTFEVELNTGVTLAVSDIQEIDLGISIGGGLTLNCSGEFQESTGVYTDYIFYEGKLFWVRFESIIDSGRLLLTEIIEVN